MRHHRTLQRRLRTRAGVAGAIAEPRPHRARFGRGAKRALLQAGKEDGQQARDKAQDEGAAARVVDAFELGQLQSRDTGLGYQRTLAIQNNQINTAFSEFLPFFLPSMVT